MVDTSPAPTADILHGTIVVRMMAANGWVKSSNLSLERRTWPTLPVCR